MSVSSPVAVAQVCAFSAGCFCPLLTDNEIRGIMGNGVERCGLHTVRHKRVVWRKELILRFANVRKLSIASCALFLLSLPLSAKEVEGSLLNDESGPNVCGHPETRRAVSISKQLDRYR